MDAFAGQNPLYHESQVRRRLKRTVRTPCFDRPGYLDCGRLLAELFEKHGQLLRGPAVDDGSGRQWIFARETHIERAFFVEAETPFGFVEMQRTDAEVEDGSSQREELLRFQNLA